MLREQRAWQRRSVEGESVAGAQTVDVIDSALLCPFSNPRDRVTEFHTKFPSNVHAMKANHYGSVFTNMNKHLKENITCLSDIIKV